MRRWLSLLILGALVVACGGSAPPAAAPAATTPEAAPSADPARSSARGAAAPPDARAQFIASCTKSDEMSDYCGCAWGVVSRDFADLATTTAGNPPADRLEAFRHASQHECAAKLPEHFIHNTFVEGCAGDEPALLGFCECMWTSLRATLPASDLAREEVASEARFVVAKKSATASCNKSLPEEPIHHAFVKGCMKTGPNYQAFCDCSWKQMRAHFSLGEIASGATTGPDKQTVSDSIVKVCRPLAPAPH